MPLQFHKHPSPAHRATPQRRYAVQAKTLKTGELENKRCARHAKPTRAARKRQEIVAVTLGASALPSNLFCISYQPLGICG